MKVVNIINIIFFLFITNQSLAHKKKFKLKNQNVLINTPESWQVATKFLSASLTLFGPYENGKRPIIMISESDVHNYDLNKESKRKNLSKFKQGRKEWLKKNKASLIKFHQYGINDWNHLDNIHSTGYEYTLLGEHYIEKNYFFTCNSELFHLSTLKTKKQLKKHGKEIQSVLNSIQCKTKKS